MSHDDVLFGFRLRLFSLAGEIGVRPACRAMGVHHSTYYRWKRRVDRWGLEALRVRERRRPRMPNELGPHLEQRILAFSLAHPGFGPKRISAELARERWGGLRISPNGVWRCLRRHGLNTRTRRLSLVAGYAARYERKPSFPEPERHIEASHPGELVGLDCFYVGRLSGTKGAVWQYTAIDVSSGFAWAELHASPRNPRTEHCSALVRRVASELAQAGWRLQAVITDNGSEFRAGTFMDTLSRLGVEQRRIRAGRPQTNGHVERLQQTILEECWRPSFARSLVPRLNRARTRPRSLPRLLQLRPSTHRPPNQGKRPRRDRLRCAQGEAEVSVRRYISRSGHARARRMTVRATSTVLIENDRVRVTQWRFAAGAATGWHVHEYDYVIVPLRDGTLELVEPDGTRDSHLTVGAPYFREAGVEHDVINANNHEFTFIEIELRQ